MSSSYVRLNKPNVLLNIRRVADADASFEPLIKAQRRVRHR